MLVSLQNRPSLISTSFSIERSNQVHPSERHFKTDDTFPRNTHLNTTNIRHISAHTQDNYTTRPEWRGLYSIKRDGAPQRSQDIPPRLRRQICLETNAIQIQTNSPGAEEAVYQEICPSLLGRAKFVFPFPLLAPITWHANVIQSFNHFIIMNPSFMTNDKIYTWKKDIMLLLQTIEYWNERNETITKWWRV